MFDKIKLHLKFLVFMRQRMNHRNCKGIKFIILFLSIIFSFIPSLLYAESFHDSSHQNIAYVQAGNGSPIVFIHAFPFDKRLWQPQLELLKEHFRVIAIDLWGFGESKATSGKNITIDSYAEELNELFKHLHLKNAVLVGESMGGYIALTFAKNFPEKTAGLILSSTQTIADSAATVKQREETAREIMQKGTQVITNGFIEKAVDKNAPFAIKEQLQQIIESQTANAMVSALRAMSQRKDMTSFLASLRIPILIIAGQDDKIIPVIQSQEMHKVAKRSRLAIIRNSGHLPSFEKPEQWNQAVIDMFYSPPRI